MSKRPLVSMTAAYRSRPSIHGCDFMNERKMLHKKWNNKYDVDEEEEKKHEIVN